MQTDKAVPFPLQALANKTGNASPSGPQVKVERSCSPPALIEDTSGIIEDEEIAEQQDAAGSLCIRGELQISALENSALKDRFGRLERQYSELQDLASAYSEVIRGFSPAHGQTVSIDQLQAEAGRDGLRAKALEADVLRPLIREVGGLQALISQIQTMKTLIHNAGGLRELEKFVSDLQTIRDTLNEFRGPRGLDGLVLEVRELLKSQQEYAALKSRVDGPNGLEVKAARYDKLIQAFTDVQRGTVAASVMMNPARARLISETPFEADPDRDLYEGPQPVAKPFNKTGSNNTPLGTPQVQAIAQPASQATGSSTLKRESADIAPSVSAKRPRVDVGRASAMVHASLIATNAPVARASIRSNTATGLKTRAQSRHVESEGTVLKNGGSGLRAQTATAPPKMSDWMCTDVRFGSVGFTTKFGTRIPTHSSPPPSEPHADTRSAPTRFAPTNSSSLVTRSAAEWGSLAKEPTVAQARHMNYPVAFLVYRPDAITNWNTYPISDLKRIPEVPHDLFTFVVGEFSRHVPIAKAAEFHTMGPGMKTCIIRHIVDGHRPFGPTCEQYACWQCTDASRPCAHVQDISGVWTIVFLPLRECLRRGVRWSERAYWIKAAQ